MLPVVSVLSPRLIVPEPAIEPALTFRSPSMPVVAEKSMMPLPDVTNLPVPALVPSVKTIKPKLFAVKFASAPWAPPSNSSLPVLPATPLTTKVGA